MKPTPAKKKPIEDDGFKWPAKNEGTEFDSNGLYIGKTMAITSDGHNFGAEMDDDQQIK